MKRRAGLQPRLAALLLVLSGCGQCALAAEPVRLHEPQRLTASAEPVRSFDVTPDGRWLVYAAGASARGELRITSADPSQVEVPRTVGSYVAESAGLAVRPDGRRVAFVSTERDARGDIYLVGVSGAGRPRRLTDEAGEDGAPAFAADGSLYLQRRAPGAFEYRIAHIAAPEAREPVVRILELGGDASQPAPSPDGSRLAFVSYRQDPGGDLFLADLRGGGVTALTTGPALDSSPAWTPDGRALVFVRRVLDNDGDGRLTTRDRGVLQRLPLDGNGAAAGMPRPLTSWNRACVRPRLVAGAGEALLFIVEHGGDRNLWRLPGTGRVPVLAGAQAQADLAVAVEDAVPEEPALAVLAHAQVLARFPGLQPWAARAAYHSGRLYRAAGYPLAARGAFAEATAGGAVAWPEAGLAALARVALATRATAATGAAAEAQHSLLAEARGALSRVVAVGAGSRRVAARALLEEARLTLDLIPGAAGWQPALELLERLVAEFPEQSDAAAEAWFLRAELIDRLGAAAAPAAAYLRVLDLYPEVEPWSGRAVERIVGAGSRRGAAGAVGDTEFIRLRRLAAEQRAAHPRLAMGALNRIGDLLYAADEWARAKDAYRETLAFVQETSQRSAARLALAEILYREERFRDALDLYRGELQARPVEDPIYRLARKGYVRKTDEAGRFLYRLGEVAAARSLYRDLIRFDGTLAVAHRGYIGAAAALGDAVAALAEYRRYLEAEPRDPLRLYTVGLCLTYADGDAAVFREALQYLEGALRLEAQVEYYHQTLGYVHEVLETVHGEPGHLEEAVAAYRRALYLNDPQSDPHNAVNLALNLGNAHFLLGQYEPAFRYYSRRLESAAAFSDPETELLFYRRFGAAAFQVRATERSVELFETAAARASSRADPLAASAALDRLLRTVETPLVEAAARADTAPLLDLRETAAGLREQLLEYTSAEAIPVVPSPQWKRYVRNLEGLLDRVEELGRRTGTALGADASAGWGERLDVGVSRVRDALRSPLRLAALQAEIQDRLALAYQEAGRHAEAATAFEAVFDLCRRLDLTANLGRARRGAAHARYLQAGQAAGEERLRLLQRAAAQFEEARGLIVEHGVPAAAPPAQGGALLNLTFEVSLAGDAASTAARGFTVAQELRLIDAFLSRIALERGDLAAARAGLEPLLAGVEEAAAVAPRERYGASLLWHRDGLLAQALGDTPRAVAAFRRSGALARLAGNAGSAALNAVNLALLAAPEDRALWASVEAEDRAVRRALAGDPAAASGSAALQFHTAFGRYWLEVSRSPVAAGADLGAARLQQLGQAIYHGRAGLALLPAPERIEGRADLGRAARLHLNLGLSLADLGDRQEADVALALARDLARRGWLGDLEWRARAALGDLEGALAVLAADSPLRGHAGPGEVESALGGLVAQRVREGRGEEAFALAEQLAELERVRLLAPLTLGALTEADWQVVRAAFPHLERRAALVVRLGAAEGEERTYLEEQLGVEEQLLVGVLGPAGERVPAPVVDWIGGRDGSYAILELLGLLERAEDAAQAGLGANPEDAAAAADPWVARFHRRLSELVQSAAGVRAPGALALFGPQPAELVEVLEALEPGEVLVRVVPTDAGQRVVLRVTADSLDARIEPQGAGLELPRGSLTVAGPAAPPAGAPAALRTLSASHWLRSRRARKPFKSSLAMLLPPAAVPEGFELLPTPGQTEAPFLEVVPGAHTLVLNGALRVNRSVPTRRGESGRRRLLVLGPGSPLDVAALGPRLTRASLVLLPPGDPAAEHAALHLLALGGVPTVVMHDGRDPAALDRFLGTWREARADTAMAAAGPSWRLYGDRGLAAEAAAELARASFGDTVRRAQRLYRDGEHETVLVLVEDALRTARDAPSLARYLGDLYQFGREAAYAAGQVAEAARYAGALVEWMADARPDSAAHAEALLRLGLLLTRLERFPQAVAALEEAHAMLAALDAVRGRVEALAGLGSALENAAQYDRALDSYQTAAEVGSGTDDRGLLAVQYTNLGRLYDLRLSRWARAEEEYRRALELYRELADPDGIARSLVDIGRCRRLLGDFVAAAQHYGEALEVVEGAGLGGVAAARVIIEQANNAWFQGRYQEAFTLQRKTDALARAAGWDLGRVLAANTAGLIWWTLGDHERALRELEGARERAARLPGRADEVATSLNNLGLVYREMGRFDAAEEHLEQALAIDRRLGSRWALAYDLRNLGLTHLRRGDAAAALPLLREAEAEAQAIGDQVNRAKALLGLAETQGLLGDAGVARASYETALALAREMALGEVEWRALHGLAGLDRAAGKLAAARQAWYGAVDRIEELRAAIRLEQLRDGFLVDKQAPYAALVLLLVEQGEPEAAFDVAERSRARNFIDLLGNQRLRLGGGVAEALYQRSQTLRARIEAQAALVAQARGDVERARYAAVLATLRDQYADLLLEIQAAHPELASLVAVAPARLAALQELLEPGVVLLSYYVLEQELLCWVLERERTGLVRVPVAAATLGERVFRFRRRIQNLEPYQELARELHGWLWAPVAARLQEARYVGVVPHGALHYLAFATLSDGATFVGEGPGLFYLPSASVLPYTLGRRRADPPPEVLAVGNPELDQPGLDLPFAEQEVNSLRWRFPEVTVLTGERATEAWVTRNLSRFGVIHIASHGEFDPVNPLFSALKLAPAEAADGNLEAGEVFDLQVRADLVVLSACQTGVGRVTGGDDVVGLNRAFFYAGTHTLISSLWRVSDVSTAVLMKHFYRRRVTGTKAEALRAAMLHVKARYPHPGYWGAFVLAGDYL